MHLKKAIFDCNDGYPYFLEKARLISITYQLGGCTVGYLVYDRNAVYDRFFLFCDDSFFQNRC